MNCSLQTLNHHALLLRRSSYSIWKQWRGLSSQTSAPPNPKDEIVIPKRINRGPTDVLKALASTVGRDYTAAHYKFHDDPYLMPASSFMKRSLALSKEAGRKAARFIRDKHGDLFQHRDAEPFIEAFAPKLQFTEESDVNEEILNDLIEKNLLNDAAIVYNLLAEKGIDVSRKTRQKLLELASFYNEEEPLDEDYLEERSFQGGMQNQRQRWKEGGLADILFESMSPPDSESYQAMIRGTVKHMNADKAWTLYREMLSKGLTADVETFNYLIKTAPVVKEDHQQRWALIEEILKDMASKKVAPNCRTLNSCLEVLARQGKWRLSTNKALELLAEFRSIKIEPSLATYYLLLRIFNIERRTGGSRSTILHDIIDHIEGQQFESVDVNDTQFFVTAMDVCRNHLNDVQLAYRVDALLHTGDNYNFIGNDFRESAYYRHLFILICTTEPMEVFMDVYTRLVPHVYSPEPAVMQEILKAMEVSASIEYIPRIWADMCLLDLSYRPKLLEPFLTVLMSHLPQPDSELHHQYKIILHQIWDTLARQEEKRTESVWTGQLIGDVMCMSGKLNDMPLVVATFTKCKNSPDSVIGVPSPEALRASLECAIAAGYVKLAVKMVEYSEDIGYPESADFAKLVMKEANLNQEQKAKMQQLYSSTSSSSSTSSTSSSDSDAEKKKEKT